MAVWTIKTTDSPHAIRAETGDHSDRKVWVAHLTDTDDKYRFTRDFVCFSGFGEAGDTGGCLLDNGAVIEVVDEPRDGSRSTRHAVIRGGCLTWIGDRDDPAFTDADVEELAERY